MPPAIAGRGLQAELESRRYTAPELGMVAETGGGDRSAGGSALSYGAASTPSSGGGHAMASDGQASGRRSSSECMKNKSSASHASSTHGTRVHSTRG